MCVKSSWKIQIYTLIPQMIIRCKIFLSTQTQNLIYFYTYIIYHMYKTDYTFCNYVTKHVSFLPYTVHIIPIIFFHIQIEWYIEKYDTYPNTLHIHTNFLSLNTVFTPNSEYYICLIEINNIWYTQNEYKVLFFSIIKK